MNIIKKNTTPAFEIVPRKKLNVSLLYKFLLVSEFTQVASEVLASVELLDNENYLITMQSFPTGKINEKLSYTIVETLSNEVVSLGKLMIVSENENIQDYTKKENTKYYR